MNAVFNQVEFIHRLEEKGITRGAAEAIASGIDDGRRDPATTSDMQTLRRDLDTSLRELRRDLDTGLGGVRSEIVTLRSDLEKSIELMGARLIVRVGVGLAAGLTAMIAVLGLLISIK